LEPSTPATTGRPAPSDCRACARQCCVISPVRSHRAGP
jgi:hypothetical protein